MANIKIEVIAIVGPSYIKTPRGGYNQIEVAYKDGAGKVGGKKLVDFNSKEVSTNEEVFKIAKGFQPGERYSVTSEKIGDYWYWTSISAANESAEQTDGQAPASDAGNQNGSSEARPAGATGVRGKVTGSNYETPEERKLRRDFDQLKHKQIGRQGCINSALEYMTANYKEFSVDEVLETAEKFRAWSFQD